MMSASREETFSNESLERLIHFHYICKWGLITFINKKVHSITNALLLIIY